MLNIILRRFWIASALQRTSIEPGQMKHWAEAFDPCAQRLNRSRIAALTSSNCDTVSLPNFLANLCRSKLASPCTLTADTLGNHFGCPKSTSPRIPRICEVKGATITNARALSGSGYDKTSTGRPFSIMPRSANQTSPALGLVFTECFVPVSCLLLIGDKPFRVRCDGKWEVFP